MALDRGDDDGRHRRHTANPRWNPAIVSSSPSAPASPRMSGSPGTPPGASICRCRPAENDAPSARITTTRTSGGSVSPTSARASHIDGVWALRARGWTGSG